MTASSIAARLSSLTPEHLINSAKLYDIYVNRFNEGKYTHTACIHLTPVIQPDNTSATPNFFSAPLLMDLLNAENIEPADVDITGQEQQLFNHPDPYDLEEAEPVDEALRPTVIRSSFSFNIAKYIKLDDPKLMTLITKVDTDASSTQGVQCQHNKLNLLGERSVESFIGL